MAKERSKAFLTQCEVADDPVVVLKLRPMKAGNSLEDKTEVTQRPCSLGECMSQKPCISAKG